MRILCVADHKDPLIYSENLKKRYGSVDMVLGAGDLDLEYYGFIVSVLNKPLYFVFGNHNLKHFHRYKRHLQPHYSHPDPINQSFFGSTYIGDKVKKHGPLLIAGLGGSRRYNRGNSQYTDFQMYIKIWKLIPRLLWNKIRYGRYLDILLTHAPPKGIHDQDDPCHTGFKSFIWFMKRFSPKFLIHGHIHIYDNNKKRHTQFLSTLIFNAYDHIVIDTEKEYE